jgi:hypothetical protein
MGRNLKNGKQDGKQYTQMTSNRTEAVLNNTLQGWATQMGY